VSRYDQLRHIAGLVGITLRHVDALGVWHEPGEEVLSRLIAALGLPDDPEAAAAVLAAEAASAPFGLAPLQVIAAEDPSPTLAVRPPAESGETGWQLRLEDGSEQSGKAEAGWLVRLPGGLLPGYHRLELVAGGETASVTLAVAPRACHLPAGLSDGARSWGLTTQLYGVRTARNWGMGDFADLATLARTAGSLGAAVLGLNPMHALFAAEPRHFSPYSPSSRSLLDYLYIDVTAVPGFAEDDAARALASDTAVVQARAAGEVDHVAVAALKRPVLEALYRRLENGGSGAAALAAFRAFEAAGGTSSSTAGTGGSPGTTGRPRCAMRVRPK
jgi:glycogen debranching enzyme